MHTTSKSFPKKSKSSLLSIVRPSCWILPVLDPQYKLMKSVHMFKAGLVCDREDNEESISCPHILLPHCTELLLAGRIQHWEEVWVQMHHCTQQTPIFTFTIEMYLLYTLPCQKVPHYCFVRPSSTLVTVHIKHGIISISLWKSGNLFLPRVVLNFLLRSCIDDGRVRHCVRSTPSIPKIPSGVKV